MPDGAVSVCASKCFTWCMEHQSPPRSMSTWPQRSNQALNEIADADFVTDRDPMQWQRAESGL